MREQSRWIVAFDASCGTCREISQAVGAAAGDKLEVLPLSRVDVRQWREQALGADAPWAPTLIRVADVPQAWTGVGLAARLVRAIGPLASIRVLRALGQLKYQKTTAQPTAMGRRSALRIGAGVAVAAGMILAGGVPAFGATAASWAAKHKDTLPRDYDQFSSYSLTYRRAIFRELPADARATLWAEQLRRYRVAHPGLTDEQRAVLGTADRMLADTSIFGNAPTEAHYAALDQLRTSAKQAFSEQDTAALFGTLGPSENPAMAPDIPDCNCSNLDSYCGSDWVCPLEDPRNPCTWQYHACGFWWRYDCDGQCSHPE